ncbi:MAG: xanthine dehydrogenase family protein molybdopterin-binding subunit [Acidimicrobiia bacterium]
MTRLPAEDLPFLVGTARFTADLDAADAWHVRFVRSPLAHATVRAVHVPPIPNGTDGGPSGAVLTDADLGVQPYVFFPAVGYPRPLLAHPVARYVGDPVALVAAPTAAEAEDLAEQVELDLDPMPAGIDLWAALEDPARIVNTVRQAAAADPLAGAAVVVRRRCANPRLSPLPLETSAIVVRPLDGGRGLDVWAACQGVHAVRDDLAAALGLPADAVRVRAPSVGGGFGARYRPPIEYLTVAAAAVVLGRPLRWVEDRTEQLLSQPAGRGHELDVALGVTADGRFTGLVVRGVADAGAYPGQGPLLVEYTRKMAPGPYRMPAVDFEVSSVTTTTAPVGAYRGAGQPEIVAAVETLVDEAARALGLTPVELRRRNLLQPEELPTTTVTGVRYDRADLPAALDTVAARLEQWRAADAARSWPASTRLGYGLASYAQITGVGQLSMRAQLAVRSDGTVVAGAGSHSHGQGHRSTFAALVGRRLGIDPASIEWVDADTAAVSAGHGTGGSRSSALTGNALHHAAEALLQRARALVADHLEADPADLVVGDGGLAVAGVPTSLMGWAAIAGLAGDDGLAVTHDAEPMAANTPYGAHGCAVAVDTETGAVRVLHHLAVDDCGTRLSPALVEGQQHGGAVAGIAQALGEQLLYDADGTPRTTTLLDYVVPGATEVPFIEVGGAELAADTNAVGARGIGENGAIAATPAVLNAVADALGVPFVGLPLTPERIWRLLAVGTKLD